MRILRYWRHAWLAMACDANLLRFGATPVWVCVGENLQQVGRPHHLRNWCWWRAIGNLLPCGRSRQNSKRPADRGVGVNSVAAALDDRNDHHAQHNAAEHNAENCDARPNPPWLIEDVGLGLGCMRHG